VDKVRNNFVN